MNVRKLLVHLFSLTILFTACAKDEEEPFVYKLSPYKILQFSANQPASRVLGQNDFVSNEATTSQNRLSSPQGVDLDSRGTLRISDSLNNRIVGYNSIPNSSGTNADFLLGQTSFSANTVQPIQANSFTSPKGLRSGEGKFVVVDPSNNRVLIYRSPPTTHTQNADVVIGAANFQSTGGGGCNATDLNSPSDAFIIAGKLIISDTGNNRVLIYNSIPTSNFATASLVVGQPNASTCSGATTDNKLSGPAGIWSDGTKLLVADQLNNRVLAWTSFPAVDGPTADLVLGQPDFISSTSNNGGISASSLNNPSSVAFSSLGQVFVSDMGNCRVLIWNSFPMSNQTSAHQVLGQSNMTEAKLFNPPTASSLSSPRNILINYGGVVVADTGNNRVLIFNTH